MRTLRFILFIVLSFTISCAWADILPRPGPRPDRERRLLPPETNQSGNPPDSGTAASPQTRDSESGASMASADVQVRIRQEEAKPKTGDKISTLVIDVSGEFDMVCSETPKEEKDLEVLFPIDYVDETLPMPVRFDVDVDGKPVSDVKADTWSVTDEHNRPRTQWGFSWRVPALASGQKRRVAVRYSFVVAQNEGKAHFIYFLRSGARWDGPIGREVVNVTADKGLRLEVLSPSALKPEQRSDTSITWKVTNSKPAEDIHLVIALGAKP